MTQTAKGKETSKGEKEAVKDGAFLERLKKKCLSCTENSIKVYLRSIRRLHLLVGEGPIPETGAWLTKEPLMTAFRKLPLTQRRSLSVAAVKAGHVYGKPPEKWNTEMFKAQSLYTNQRSKNLKTDKEKELWPKGGFSAIRKAATEQRRRIRHVLGAPPTLGGLYRYGMYLVLRLFSELPWRNGFADLQLKKTKEGNYIELPARGKAVFHLLQYKNVKQLGKKAITLGRANTAILRKFLEYRSEAGVEHNYLLSTTTGKRMTRSALGKALHKALGDLTGKKFGSRLIRVLAATENKAMIDKSAALSEKMLHSQKQTKAYTRK